MDLSLAEGEVWWAAPSPTVGREQSGRRPVVVVSGEEYHATMTTLALVVPVSTRDRGWPHHIRLRGVTHLASPSWAMTEQVRVVSRERLVQRTGIVDTGCLDEIRGWLLNYLR